MKLLEIGSIVEALTRTLVAKLATKETDIGKRTIYHALETPEFKDYKSESHASRRRGKKKKGSENSYQVLTTKTQHITKPSTSGRLF